MFHDVKAGGGFKSFAVNYDGGLNASAIQGSEGHLKLKLSGTPELIKISDLRHNGVAGQIVADGLLHLNQGVSWNLNASLIRFKPHYFVSSVRGELSGNIRTQGIWSDTQKRINIERLNLAGMLNNKPVRGTGNLAMLIDANQKKAFYHNSLKPIIFFYLMPKISYKQRGMHKICVLKSMRLPYMKSIQVYVDVRMAILTCSRSHAYKLLPI